MWGIHSYFIGGDQGYILAKVNNTEITKEQFAHAFQIAVRQAQIQAGATPLTNQARSSN